MASSSPGSSDDEEMFHSKPAVGRDMPSGPLSNAFENLYDRLVGEESDFDHLETVSTAMFDPSNITNSLGESGDTDDSSHHGEGMPDVVCSVSQEELVHGGTRGTDNVDPGVGLENTIEGRSNEYSLNESVVQAISGKKPPSAEKCRYPTERSFQERELLIPFQKQVWKETHHWSVRSFPKHTVAKEGVEQIPEVTGFQSKQLLGKHTRVKKHPMGGQTGVAVWTKKASKSCDTACDKTGIRVDCTDFTSEHMCQPCVEEPETSADVSAVDSSHDSVSSSTRCVLSTECSCGLSQSSSGAFNDGGTCGIGSQFAPRLPSDLGGAHEPYQAGQALSSLSSVVVGTVVIGSLCVSLVDLKNCPDQTTVQSNTLKDSMDGRMVVEASERKATGSVQLSGKLEESVQALHENGAINYVPHKEPEKDAKSLKLALQIDSEEKENHEHSLNLGVEGKCSRPIVAQGGNSRGGRLKMWRPVVLTDSNEPHDRFLTSVPLNRDTVTSTIQSTVMGEKSSKSVSIDPAELQQGVQDLEGECVRVGQDTRETVKIEDDVLEGGSIVSSVSESTLEAVSHFLIQRWSAAVDDPETVVFSVEDEGRNDGLCDVTNEHDRNLRNLFVQESKASSGFPGNGKLIRSYWKQACSGGAMTAGQRSRGKNISLPGAPRVGGYRYVPK